MVIQKKKRKKGEVFHAHRQIWDSSLVLKSAYGTSSCCISVMLQIWILLHAEKASLIWIIFSFKLQIIQILKSHIYRFWKPYPFCVISEQVVKIITRTLTSETIWTSSMLSPVSVCYVCVKYYVITLFQRGSEFSHLNQKVWIHFLLQNTSQVYKNVLILLCYIFYSNS